MLSSDRHRSGRSVSMQTHIQTSSASWPGETDVWKDRMATAPWVLLQEHGTYTNEEAEWASSKCPFLGGEDRQKELLERAGINGQARQKQKNDGISRLLPCSPAQQLPVSNALITELQNTPSDQRDILDLLPNQISYHAPRRCRCSCFKIFPNKELSKSIPLPEVIFQVQLCFSCCSLEQFGTNLIPFSYLPVGSFGKLPEPPAPLGSEGCEVGEKLQVWVTSMVCSKPPWKCLLPACDSHLYY